MSHSARRWQSWELNPGTSESKAYILSAVLCYLLNYFEHMLRMSNESSTQAFLSFSSSSSSFFKMRACHVVEGEIGAPQDSDVLFYFLGAKVD